MSSGAAALLMLASLDAAGRVHHDRDDSSAGPLFQAGGLQFVMPEHWIAQTPVNNVRAGQWRLPAVRGTMAGLGDGELVVFYFGPGLGGTVAENVQGWRESMRDGSDQLAAGDVTTRQAGGLKISEVILKGSYRDPAPMAGLPPVLRPGYELAAAVVEGPKGLLYWRLIGPEPLVTPALPLLRQAIDSVKPLPGG